MIWPLREFTQLDLFQQGLPAWYGVAYWRELTATGVIAPLPFHRVIGWGRAGWIAFRVRGTPSLLEDAYQRGRTAECASWRSYVERLQAHHAAELEREVEKARIELIEDITKELGIDTPERAN